jgi:uncharacterized membrane protein
MVSKSPEARVAPILLGGVGLCGLQLYHLLNATPGANYWVLIGGLVGAAVGTSIGVAFALRRPVQAPEPKALSDDERERASETKKRWAKNAYVVCVVAWVVAGLAMVILAMVNSEQIAIVIAIVLVLTFMTGLVALIIGKALGDASKR